MAGGTLNLVVLIGNLGDAPRMTRKTRSGSDDLVIANFSIATSDRIKKGDGYEAVTTWHSCFCFGGLAEVIEKYTKKGDKINVVGSIQRRKYLQDGVERFAVDVKVTEVNLLSKRDDAVATAAAAAASAAAQDGFGDFDDADNPFNIGNSVPA